LKFKERTFKNLAGGGKGGGWGERGEMTQTLYAHMNK
jgi:hypothetical protein